MYYRWKITIKISLDIYEFCFLNSYKLYLIKLNKDFFKSPFQKKNILRMKDDSVLMPATIPLEEIR